MGDDLESNKEISMLFGLMDSMAMLNGKGVAHNYSELMRIIGSDIHDGPQEDRSSLLNESLDQSGKTLIHHLAILSKKTAGGEGRFAKAPSEAMDAIFANPNNSRIDLKLRDNEGKTAADYNPDFIQKYLATPTTSASAVEEVGVERDRGVGT